MTLWRSQQGEPLPTHFFDVAKQVYAGDPSWPVEDEEAVRALFSPAHRYGAAIDWEVCGVADRARAALFFDERLRVDGGPAAFFGFWEGVEDAEAHQAIFDFAEGWARARGAARLYGPINFSTYHPYRIRTDGFPPGPPFPGESYNPRYYADILIANGYQSREKYLTFRSNARALPVFEQAAPAFEAQLAAAGLRASPLTPAYWLENRARIYPVFDATWRDNFGYIPLPYETFHQLFDERATRKIDPHLSTVVHDADGNLAGYLVAYPNYGELLAQGNPGRVRESELCYETHFPRLESPELLVKSACVVPAYRSQGLFTAMSVLACARARSFGYQKPIACMMRSDNPSAKMGEFLQRLDPQVAVDVTTYQLFVKSLSS